MSNNHCYVCNPHATTTEICDSCRPKVYPPKYISGNIELKVPPHIRKSPFYQILVNAADLHARKNSNYAGKGGDPFKNFKECEDFGISAWKGVLVRLSDKWMRIKNLADGVADEVGEDITETLIDLLVYAGICICLIKGENE